MTIHGAEVLELQSLEVSEGVGQGGTLMWDPLGTGNLPGEQGSQFIIQVLFKHSGLSVAEVSNFMERAVTVANKVTHFGKRTCLA